MKRLVILTPEMRGEGGHDLPYHTALWPAWEQAGYTVSAYAHASCQIDPTRWKPWFGKRGFLSLFKREKGSLLFLEAFNTHHLIRLTLAALLTKPRLALLFRHEPPRSFLGRALQVTCVHLLKKRLTLFSETEQMAALHAKRFRLPVTVLPLPNRDVPCGTRPPNNVCISPGAPRPEKGTAYIEKLIALADPTFTILTSPTPLTRDAYWEHFLSATYVLLPYCPLAYRRRTSGVFVEAILAGKIPLVTPSTWMAAELKRFNLHTLIRNWDDPLFFPNLNLPADTHEKLANMREAYAATHSPESFVAAFERAKERAK